MEENRFWNHPDRGSDPSLVTFQLSDLQRPRPFSETHGILAVELIR